MNTGSQSTYARPPVAARIATAVAAVTISATVMGGVLSLFDMRSNKTTMAHAQPPAQPNDRALAVRDNQNRSSS